MLLTPEEFHQEIEDALTTFAEHPAHDYASQLCSQPPLTVQLSRSPFPESVTPTLTSPLPALYTELQGLARGTSKAFRGNNEMGTYLTRKRWLGDLARQVGDLLLVEAGLFPEVLFSTRPSSLYRAADFKNAIAYGQLFYDFAVRLDGIKEEVGRDLQEHFVGWAECFHKLKGAFDLWARDARVLLKLQEIGLEPRGLENVVAFSRGTSRVN